MIYSSNHEMLRPVLSLPPISFSASSFLSKFSLFPSTIATFIDFFYYRYSISIRTSIRFSYPDPAT